MPEPSCSRERRTEHGAVGGVGQRGLEQLDLQYNRITDAGCATLASALRGGALPALKQLDLRGNPASDEAKGAVYGSRAGLTSPFA